MSDLIDARDTAKTREQLIDELRQSEARFRLLFEKAPLGYQSLDENGCFMEVNQTWLNTMGYSREEVIGKSFSDFLHPDWKDHFRVNFPRFKAVGEVLGVEFEMLKKDGSSILVSFTGKIGKDAKGRFKQTHCILHDITERKQAEEQLASQRALLKGIFDNIPVLLVMWESQLQRFTLNRHTEFVLGWTTADANDGDFMSKVYPDAEYRANVSECMQSLKFGWHEWTCATKAGHFVPIDWANIRLSDDTMIGIGVDLRERKQIEEQLRRNHETFYNLIQNNPFGVYVIDSDFRILQASLGARKVFRNVDPLIGRDFAEVLRLIWEEPFASEAVGRFRHTLESGEPYTSPSTVELRRDIQEVEAYDWRIERIILPDGSYGVVCFFYDLSERQRFEAALRQSEHLYRMLAANLPNGAAFVVNRELRYILAEGQALQQAGMESGDLEGKTLMEALEPDLLNLYKPYYSQALAGKSSQYEHNAHGRTYISHLTPLIDENGSISAALAVSYDITERKQTEDALKELTGNLEKLVAERTAVAKERARQLQQLALELSNAEDKERKRMAMILHDDLQQHLGALRFNLFTLLPEKMIDGETKERLLQFEGLIDQAIKKTRSLSHELSPPVLHQSGFLAGLKWLVQDVQEKHGQQVTFKSMPEAEPKSTAVTSILYRSVRELLFNALKHSGTKTAFVEAGVEGDFIRISVKDHGQGCDVETVKARASDAPGFGLFNIEERINFLGGQFEIDSTPGNGCCVTLRVPKDPESTIQAVQVSTYAIPEKNKQNQPYPTDQVRIMLVDDHASMRQGMSMLLKPNHDFELIAEASNGIDAVKMAQEFSPDVILMDVSMPVMDGIEATAIIKKNQPYIRIIGLSMHEDEKTEQRMIAAGASAYISKVAPVTKIIEVIRNGCL